MPMLPPEAQVSPQGARAPVVASQQAGRCEACGEPMPERKGKRACSARCRATLSRRSREQAQATRDRELRALLEAALKKLGNWGVDRGLTNGYSLLMQPSVTTVKPNELSRIREELGLTQEALADEVGVHRVTVARWESGARAIPEPVARLIEKIRAERKRRKR